MGIVWGLSRVVVFVGINFHFGTLPLTFSQNMDKALNTLLRPGKGVKVP